MKRIFVALVIIVIMVGCSQKNTTKLTYTKEGVGVLKFGAKVDELPAKVDGMYDRIESIYDDFDSGTHNYFYLGEELKYETTWDNEIVNITIFDKNVDLGGFSVGDPVAKILSMDLVYKPDRYGVSVYLNDCCLWFDSYTHSGEEKRSSLDIVKFDENDFPSDAKLKAVLCNKF